MRKSLFILLLGFLLFLPLTNSCDKYIEQPPVKKSHWELTSAEFWGVEPQPDAQYRQFGSFPFNLTYPWGIDTYTYSGLENNITRSEFWGLGKVTMTVTFTWSQIPDIIYPDTDYTVTYESKGNLSGGILVSKPGYYVDSFVWFPLAGHGGGPQTATFRMTAPDANPNHQKGKIGVTMVSGRSYYMEWWYIYEWVQ